MLRVWNVTLVIVTFFLTIFGTFMTRSGVVQSVHAFGEDRELALLFTIFMVFILTFSFGWVIYRLPLLRSRNELDSFVSREAAFLANNWILLFSAFFVLFATMFPTLSEAVTGERLTVAAPFFNRWMLPIGLMLLTLTGIGPLLAWRKSTVSNLIYQLKWPVLAFFVTAGALYALGVRVWSSGTCFALCAMVLTTIVQEFVRGAQVRREATGTDILTALIGLVGRSKRRYGGYVVHVGIVLMFLGFAGEGFRQEEQALMKVGEQLTVGHFAIRHDALRVTNDSQKQMVTGHVSVFEDGKPAGSLEPAKWYFNKREEEPTTEVAIRRAITEDLYVVLAGFDASAQTATYTVTINPLVNWIWFGFGIMALGTGNRAVAGERDCVRDGEGSGRGRRRDHVAARPACSCCRRSRTRSTSRAPRPGACPWRERRSRRSCGASSSACAAPAGASGSATSAAAMRRRCASKSQSSSTRARRARRSISTSSRSTAARSRSVRRSTKASIGWPGCSPIWSVRLAPSAWRSQRCAGPGASTRPPRSPLRRAEDKTLRSRLDDELRDLD